MLASFRAAHSSRKRVTLRIMLIAMPWTDHRLPQASIAALSAYLKEREPTWNVSGEYAYLDVAAEDPELYRHIAVDHGSGDRLYATLLYPEMAPTLLQHWRTAVPDSSIWILRRDRERMGQTLETLFENLRQRLTRHCAPFGAVEEVPAGFHHLRRSAPALLIVILQLGIEQLPVDELARSGEMLEEP